MRQSILLSDMLPHWHLGVVSGARLYLVSGTPAAFASGTGPEPANTSRTSPPLTGSKAELAARLVHHLDAVRDVELRHIGRLLWIDLALVLPAEFEVGRVELGDQQVVDELLHPVLDWRKPSLIAVCCAVSVVARFICARKACGEIEKAKHTMRASHSSKGRAAIPGLLRWWRRLPSHCRQWCRYALDTRAAEYPRRAPP